MLSFFKNYYHKALKLIKFIEVSKTKNSLKPKLQLKKCTMLLDEIKLLKLKNYLIFLIKIKVISIILTT